MQEIAGAAKAGLQATDSIRPSENKVLEDRWTLFWVGISAIATVILTGATVFLGRYTFLLWKDGAEGLKPPRKRLTLRQN